MTTQFLTDKSLQLEAAFFGFALDAQQGFAEPGIADHYTPDRGFILRHIDLALTIDPDGHSLTGTAKLRIDPLPTGMGDVVLDFDDLRIDGVTNSAGEPLDFSESDGRLTVVGVDAGGEAITVQWHGSPTRAAFRS